MIYKEYLAIKKIALHNVGNKLNQDEIQFSKALLEVEEDVKKILLEYFISPFKSEEYYQFYHDTNLNLNETYTYVSKIFDNPESLYEQSINLAKHLYNQSIHPKIKEGEFYVVYFKDCVLNGETLNVVGLFKSENKETFLQVKKINEMFDIESRQGININKLDKGCLIFNKEKENGFQISIVDNTNKGTDAQYWKDHFMCVQPIKNEFHQTNQFLGIAKQFVTKQLTEGFEASKADKIDFLNKSVDYFKKHKEFDKQEFEEEVFVDSNLIESFRRFDQTYRRNEEVELSDNFEISQQAVKKQEKVFKSVLKLDHNFRIYIQGNRKLIEQGVEKDGRKYYKIYYQDES